MTDGEPQRPTFKAVRECFERDYKIRLERRQVFPNDDLTIAQFRTEDGNWAAADYRDDELIEPEILEHWCRIFGIQLQDLHVACGDGHVSVKPPLVQPLPDA